MANWTLEQVAERFREAAETAHRLPGLRSQGYFSVWPTIQRQRGEGYADLERVFRFPPTPAAIDRLEETQRCVLWLEEQQRHLLWMRAEEWPWKDIAGRLGCDRVTAWRRWQRALAVVADQLNHLRQCINR